MMKKLIYMYCLSLAVGTTAFAQDKSWWIGPSASADICYRTLSGEGGTGESIKSARDGVEMMKLGFSAGLMVRKNLGNLGFAESGLLYSNKGFSATLPVLFPDQPDPVSSNSATVLYHFNYVDLPLKMNFVTARFQRMDMYLSTGLNVNYLIEQKTVMHIFRDGKSEQTSTSFSTEEWNRGNISPLFGMGMNLRLREKIHLQVESLLRYGIIPIESSEILKTRLWTVGVNAVLYFRL